jgi:Leucine-rich repeat (LRR) protein
MKKLYFLLAICLGLSANAQIINIPDPFFKAMLLQANTINQVASTQTPTNYTVTEYSIIDTNGDGEIQVSEASIIKYLRVGNNNITNLAGIESFINLKYLQCSYCQLSSLNITNLTNLEYLNCSGNQFASIDLSGLSFLKYLDCGYSQLSSLNLMDLTNLEYLNCSGSQLTSLDVSGLSNLQQLWCNQNQLTSLNVSGTTNLEYLNCITNQLTSLDVSESVNLTELWCSNNELTNLNVNGLVYLQKLLSGNNQLTSLNVSGLTSLIQINCSDNLINSLDVSGLNNLQSLNCEVNQLASLTLTGLTNLLILKCYSNQLTSLDASELTSLQQLQCYSNLLTDLNLSGLPSLQLLSCHSNQLTTIDVSSSPNLNYLACIGNQLTSLFIKNNNTTWGTLIFYTNPNLQYICADEEDLAYVQQKINSAGLSSTCHVNSYCSFNPGGTFYTIQGSNKLDQNNNGCQVNDPVLPNAKFLITNGVILSNLIFNNTGDYSFPVESGTHIMTPQLENPSYFSVSPNNATITFPTATSPSTQNFCFVPNGVHNDLEITIIPITIARPGFNSVYKIVYKNKGTNAQSGSVNLIFNDAILDYVSSNATLSNQSLNNLNWSFTNLLPFESRVIQVTLNINSPIETPAVNNGDILNYSASITGLTDETPNDNSSILHQAVVNSFDPNNKTCIEGATVSTTMIGQYVHYIIRFENNGSANAQNIVVKDIIDTAKFDVSSLIPISSSHSFVTRITETNKVEFIFENINLPFDDANNDGYVAFKIKTKPTLVVGNTFSNTANIYFDYNFPIVTNTATTTIQTLGNSDFEFTNYITLAPNPVKNSLNIQVNQSIELSSISIYNTIGQLILVATNPSNQIDVSNLKMGTYFIKATTNKGTSIGKFIKE